MQNIVVFRTYWGRWQNKNHSDVDYTEMSQIKVHSGNPHSPKADYPGYGVKGDLKWGFPSTISVKLTNINKEVYRASIR